MRFLLNKPITETLGEYQFYFIFLDFDGTLSPIAKTPDLAVLPASTKKIIKELSKSPRVKLAVISGRKLSNIKHMVGINKIIYAGNHGMEIQGKGIERTIKVPRWFVEAKRKIRTAVRSRTKNVKGMVIEDKGLTLAVHYRMVKRKIQNTIKKAFYRATAPYLPKDRIIIRKGKMLREARPNIGWDKGKAVTWLLKRSSMKNVFPIYIGDDETDRDAFKALKNRGLTVFVGSKAKYGADYYLRDTNDVRKFLLWVKKEVN
ncbi:MAG: trehalose-phosphatase [bacterium]